MNSVNIIGNLGRDPELKESASGVKVARFSVAVSSGYGDSKRTDWLNVVAFRGTAESCSKYLHKGDPVAITGKIQTGSYENKEGRKVQTFDIIADEVQFLPKRQQAEPDGFVAMDDEPPF